MSPLWAGPSGAGAYGTFAWGGFAVASNVPLPRLRARCGEPDVAFTWRTGTPPADLPEAARRWSVPTRDGTRLELAAGGGERLLRYEVGGVGTYALRPPERSIDFYPAAGADPMQVEHSLVNSVLAVYAGLLGTVCLHAAAVGRGGGALVLAGPSGAGKSTAAWRLARRGWRLLSDDAVVLREQGGRWLAFPAARTVRLEGLAAPGSWDNRGKGEAVVPGSAGPAEVHGIVLLDRSGGKSASPAGAAALHRSLLALQAGWAWMGPGARRAVERQAWDLGRGVEVRVGVPPASDGDLLDRRVGTQSARAAGVLPYRAEDLQGGRLVALRPAPLVPISVGARAGSSVLVHTTNVGR